ncbi:MAG: hypothetical protein IT479_14145 [Xanthomonadales bacterium]|nr:hypothetical protein [Xanthomonadales bacterium]MCC6594402.1 hypothetical protein [Xanthomonadales bacterium]
MRRLIAVFALALLSGCTAERYTRHESGWWTERAPGASVGVDVSYGWYCRPSWYGPWGHTPHVWGVCGYDYGYGYGRAGYGYAYPGTWWWPYPQVWYLFPRTIEGPRAGARARHLAGAPMFPEFTRYEDLAPQRRRDPGDDTAYGARDSWPALRARPDPRRDARRSGLSEASRDPWNGGLSGAGRTSADFGGGRDGTPPGSASRSAGGAERASVDSSREER